MLEFEKKIILTQKEYKAIVALIGMNATAKTQVNYYFDTDDFDMNEKNITFRARKKDGKYLYTIKDHSLRIPNCSREINVAEKTELDPTIFGVLGLQCQGKLVTHRIVVYKASGYEMVVDRNTYLGCCDYELEVEYKEGDEQTAQKLLQDVAEMLIKLKALADPDAFMERIGKAHSKSQRFFERKEIAGGQNAEHYK